MLSCRRVRVKYDALADEPMEQGGELRVGVIGVGNMGGALVRGILARGLTSGQNVIVSDLDEKKVAELVDDLGVRSASDSSEVMDFADLVVLAAKPQAFPNLLASIATQFRPEQTIMSIAAGVTTASIESSLGGEPAIVRVMPNLPAMVGEGISVFSRGANAGDIDVERVDSVLSAVGDSLEAPEELMDPVTALSGTGPAYIFHTMEAMIESGIEMGMSPEMAERLVLQTVLGAARLAIESPLDTTALREGVTSKGGTTEAAISHLGDNDYVRLVIDAILAARDRSEQLGE